MTREEKIEAHKEMIELIDSKATEIEEEIVTLIRNFYNENSENWELLFNDIIDLIYISLKQTYKLTIRESKKTYPMIKKTVPKTVSRKEIDKYTYKKDKLTLNERVMQYINAAADKQITRDVLMSKEVRILDNETRVVFHKLLKALLKETKIEYGMLVTGHGCNRDCCNKNIDEWMPIDEIEEPPFHPNCTCEIIYGDPEDDDEEL